MTRRHSRARAAHGAERESARPYAVAEHHADAKRSLVGEHRVVPDSGHWIHLDQPVAVIESILRMLAFVGNSPIPGRQAGRSRPRCARVNPACAAGPSGVSGVARIWTSPNRVTRPGCLASTLVAYGTRIRRNYRGHTPGAGLPLHRRRLSTAAARRFVGRMRLEAGEEEIAVGGARNRPFGGEYPEGASCAKHRFTGKRTFDLRRAAGYFDSRAIVPSSP